MESANLDVIVTWVDMSNGRSTKCAYRYFGTAEDGVKNSLQLEHYGRTFHFNSTQAQLRDLTWSR